MTIHEQQVGRRKAIFTLNIGNYAPSLTELTFPMMRRLARKMDADFYVIQERAHPDWPIPCEKLQIYDLAREQGREWAWFLDADTLVHPDMFDITAHVKKDVVMHHGYDFTPLRFDPDDYHRRASTMLSPGNWWTLASDWCFDIWEWPQDLTLADCVARIHPTVVERGAGITPEHLVDDFLIGRNAAKYGLHVVAFIELCQELRVAPGFFAHKYTIPIEAKLKVFREDMLEWKFIPRDKTKPMSTEHEEWVRSLAVNPAPLQTKVGEEGARSGEAALVALGAE